MDWSWVRHPTQFIIRMSFSNSLSLVPIAWRLMVRSEFYNGAWVNLRSLYSEEKPALPVHWIDSFSLSLWSSYFIPLPPRVEGGVFYLCLYSSSSLLIHIFGVLRTNTRLFYEWKTFPSSLFLPLPLLILMDSPTDKSSGLRTSLFSALLIVEPSFNLFFLSPSTFDPACGCLVPLPLGQKLSPS